MRYLPNFLDCSLFFDATVHVFISLCPKKYTKIAQLIKIFTRLQSDIPKLAVNLVK